MRKLGLILLAIFLLSLFAVAFHSHGDGIIHSGDCSLCAIVSNSISFYPSILALEFFLIVLFSIIPGLKQLHGSADKYRQGSRAPPFSI